MCHHIPFYVDVHRETHMYGDETKPVLSDRSRKNVGGTGKNEKASKPDPHPEKTTTDASIAFDSPATLM